MGARLDIARRLAERHDVSLDAGKDMVDFVIDWITGELQGGRTVKLQGFGTFTPKVTEPHQRFSNFTSQMEEAPAKRKINFRASNLLKKL